MGERGSHFVHLATPSGSKILVFFLLVFLVLHSNRLQILQTPRCNCSRGGTMKFIPWLGLGQNLNKPPVLTASPQWNMFGKHREFLFDNSFKPGLQLLGPFSSYQVALGARDLLFKQPQS